MGKNDNNRKLKRESARDKHKEKCKNKKESETWDSDDKEFDKQLRMIGLGKSHKLSEKFQ
jgi:hypothetical protein